MPTHPYLKGLAETRARADAEYAKAASTIEGRTAYLARLTAAFKVQCQPTHRSITQAQEQAEAALRTRAACDKLIKSLNEGINPLAIEPISAWQGRYGQRGALGRLVQAIVEQVYPSEISTLAVSQELQLRLGLTFATPAERRNWQKVSVKGRLNYLHRLGLVERLHDVSGKGSEVGRWKAKPLMSLQRSLSSQAARAGVKLTYATDDMPAVAEPVLEDDNLPR